MHADQITARKAELLAGSAEIFGNASSAALEGKERTRELHEKMGELTVEHDSLEMNARTLSRSERQAMIGWGEMLTVKRQCEPPLCSAIDVPTHRCYTRRAHSFIVHSLLPALIGILNLVIATGCQSRGLG